MIICLENRGKNKNVQGLILGRWTTEEEEVIADDYIRLNLEYYIFTYTFLVSNQSHKNWG
jgi:hypothetical protein